jgi:TolB protein
VTVNNLEDFDGLSEAILAVTTNRTGTTQIFVVDVLSGDAHNISRDANSHNRYPMWSPDGLQLAFTSDRSRPDTYNLYLVDSQGCKVRQLTDIPQHGVCYFPTWSGSYIYFGLDSGDGSPAVIARINDNGSGYTVIGPGRDPAISPSGDTIAFTQKVSTGYCVFSMNADGTGVRQLTTHENKIGAVTPTWSPNGRKLLYSDEVDGKLELFCCEHDGSSQKQLTNLRQFATSPAWSPDGNFISFRVTDHDYWNYADAKEYAYKEQKADKRPVWVMRADGSDARILEVLHYQCAIDGSRAPWKPRGKSNENRS